MRVAQPPSTMWGLTMWVALVAVAWLFLQPRLHEDRPLLSSMLHIAAVLPFVTLAYLFSSTTPRCFTSQRSVARRFRSSIDLPPPGRLEKAPS